MFGELQPIMTPFPDQMLPLLTTPEPQPNLDILLSKFLNNDELNDIELQQLNEQDRLVLESVKKCNQKARKRSDQYQKLFFKRAFKYAEKEYFGKSKNKSRKMSSFYHHHFEPIAQRMGIPLVNFYHPDKKTKPGLRTGQKTFNQSYIKLLLRSDSFREVSRSYYKQFRAQCIAERRLKIPKFINYIKNIVAEHGHDPTKIIELIRARKCKVPWSNSELEEADRRAIAELYNSSSQSLEMMQEEAMSELSSERSSE